MHRWRYVENQNKLDRFKYQNVNTLDMLSHKNFNGCYINTVTKDIVKLLSDGKSALQIAKTLEEQ